MKSLISLHGGHAEADAIMFEDRHHARELGPFVRIYGVLRLEIGKSRFVFASVLMADTRFYNSVERYKGIYEGA